MDQEMKTTRNILIALLCIFLLVTGFAYIQIYRYLQGTKLKIVEDISPSEAILLQNEFGIDLPPEAMITRLGYRPNRVVIRIEGVVDLEAFLIESLCLELDLDEVQKLSDNIIDDISERRRAYEYEEDMYGSERVMTFFSLSKYQADPVDTSQEARFFKIDGELIVEISMSRPTSENRERIQEIVNR